MDYTPIPGEHLTIRRQIFSFVTEKIRFGIKKMQNRRGTGEVASLVAFPSIKSLGMGPGDGCREFG